MQASANPAAEPRARRYLANVLWNWAGVAFTLFIGFVLSPYIIHKVGDAGFGIWTLSLAFVDYYWLIDLGFRSATLKLTAEYRARERSDKINEVLSTGLVYSSLAALIVLAVTLPLAGHIGRVFHVNDPAFPLLVRIVGLSWGVGMVVNVFGASLEAFQRFDLTGRIWIAGLALRSTAIALLLYRGYGLPEMGFALFSAQMTMYLLTFVCFRRVFPQASVSLRKGSLAMFREMGRYGLHSFKVLLSTRLLGQSVPLLIAYFLPVRFVSYYAVTIRVLEHAMDGIGRVGMVTAPNATELMVKGTRADLERLGVFTNRYSLCLFLPLPIFLLPYRFELYSVWIRTDFARESAYLLPVLLLGYTAVSGQFNSVSILFGIGKHSTYSYCLLAEALVAIAGLIVVLPRHGLLGAAWVIAVLMLLNRALNVLLLVSRELRMNPFGYAARIYAAPLAVALAASLTGFWLKQAVIPGRTWPELAAAAGVVLGIYAGLAFRFCVAPHHRALLVTKARQILGFS